MLPRIKRTVGEKVYLAGIYRNHLSQEEMQFPKKHTSKRCLSVLFTVNWLTEIWRKQMKDYIESNRLLQVKDFLDSFCCYTSGKNRLTLSKKIFQSPWFFSEFFVERDILLHFLVFENPSSYTKPPKNETEKWLWRSLAPKKTEKDLIDLQHSLLISPDALNVRKTPLKPWPGLHGVKSQKKIELSDFSQNLLLNQRRRKTAKNYSTNNRNYLTADIYSTSDSNP